MPYKPKKLCTFPGCDEFADKGYCLEHKRASNRAYNLTRPDSEARGYNWKWRKAREAYLRQNPLCVECKSIDRFTPATEVDHIVPHEGDMGLFWDSANWQALCKPCHSRKTMKERNKKELDAILRPDNLKKSAIPLHIVCGPPASGKTTYARNHAGDSGVVIDLDDIFMELTGKRYAVRDNETIRKALGIRNQQLNGLSVAKASKAFFIVSAPKPEDRMFWVNKLGAEGAIVFTVPTETCIARILADPERKEVAEIQIKALNNWWRDYKRAPCDRLHISNL